MKFIERFINNLKYIFKPLPLDKYEPDIKMLLNMYVSKEDMDEHRKRVIGYDFTEDKT